MKQARATSMEDNLVDMLCFLVRDYNIGDERVLDMPYTRAMAIMDFQQEINKQQERAMKSNKTIGGGTFKA